LVHHENRLVLSVFIGSNIRINHTFFAEILLLSIFLCIMWRSMREFLVIEIQQISQAILRKYGFADFHVFLKQYRSVS